jgi:hypothetical protein
MEEVVGVDILDGYMEDVVDMEDVVILDGDMDEDPVGQGGHMVGVIQDQDGLENQYAAQTLIAQILGMLGLIDQMDPLLQ